jgi:hypothetical protein
MSTGQPINDELDTQVHFDAQAPCESARSKVRATAPWCDRSESFGMIDQIAIANPASAHSYEIKVDKSHRMFEPDDHHGGQVVLIVGALLASTAFTWFVISTLPLPLVSTSGSSVNLESSARILDSKKKDRLPMHRTISHAAEGQTTAQSPERSNRSGSTTDNETKLTLGVVSTGPTVARAGDLQSRVKLTPTPETRPTTIEGWTLREVTNGIAVLEGPDGNWRVARGDTIPGVGRVESIFRWGNRLIVATSRGLISTP